MEQATHTPGPWMVDKSCMVRRSPSGEWFHEALICHGDAETHMPTIATVRAREYRPTEREALWPDPITGANARLMAAAPDLLAACEGLLAIARISAADGADLNINIRRAEAAIAEATGQTA